MFYMTIRETVNEMCGKIVRVQVTRDGYTEFVSKNEVINDLLLGENKELSCWPCKNRSRTEQRNNPYLWCKLFRLRLLNLITR